MRKRAGKSRGHEHYERLCYEVDRQTAESRRTLRRVGGAAVFRLCVSNEQERRESSVGRARVGMCVGRYSVGVGDGTAPVSEVELDGSADDFEFERGDTSAKVRAQSNFI